MKILLLGGTGAIGKDLSAALEKRGMQVDVTTRADRAESSNVRYLKGDARDNAFLKKILQNRYNVVVDFMTYSTEEFAKRVNILLESTGQYVFLSSARVYADSHGNPITEESQRILDTITDQKYIELDEYALSKARQEDCLRKSVRKNWTIIRPYITYNDERLQLGVLEKERWLYRALRGRTIVFQKDIAAKVTTMTFGQDVAFAMADIVGNPKAHGEVFQIAGSDSLDWMSILEIYLDTLEALLGRRPDVFWERDAEQMSNALECQYQVKYDRLFERRFDSQKLDVIRGKQYLYIPIRQGLEECLCKFVTQKKKFRSIDWKWEAYADRLVGEYTPLQEINSAKGIACYMLWRYVPGISGFIKRMKKRVVGIIRKYVLISNV